MIKLEFRSFKLTVALVTVLIATHAVGQERPPSPFAVPPGQNESGQDWRPSQAAPAPVQQRVPESSLNRESERNPQNRPPSSPGGVAPAPIPNQTGPATSNNATDTAPRIIPLPNSVTLTGEDPAALIRRLNVIRQYSLNQLRTSPRMVLGAQVVNFRPIFNNPLALQNIASRLRALPRQVEVLKDEFSVFEVEQGLVIHQQLSYRILPGQCGNAVLRRGIEATGVKCAKTTSLAQKISGLSAPTLPGTNGSLSNVNPAYIKDPAQRAQVIDILQRNLNLSKIENDQHISNLRKILSDPQQRAAYSAKLGAGEVQRISSLSNERLKEEIINQAVVKHESVMFISRNDATGSPVNRMHALSPKNAAIAAKTIPSINQPSYHTFNPNESKLIAVSKAAVQSPFKAAARGAVNSKANDTTMVGSALKLNSAITTLGIAKNEVLRSYIFLTGFTLGKSNEWQDGVDFEIPWCLLGCWRSYYLRANAGFSYGFGLRFPIKTNLTYDFEGFRRNDTFVRSASAHVNLDFVPVDGNKADYQAAGLNVNDPNLFFNAQEFVAQVEAHAGFSYKVPLFGSGGNPSLIQKGVNFADYLPRPFLGGQIKPPPAGSKTPPSDPIKIPIDLLNQYGNYGIVAIQVFPAIEIGLFSESLKFTLVDNVLHKEFKNLSAGQKIPIGVAEKTPFMPMNFTLKDPAYNVGLYIIPGIVPSFSVDVEVYSNTWDWPIMFPELEIQLPPGGIDFACHDGTICSRNYDIRGLKVDPIVLAPGDPTQLNQKHLNFR